LNNAHSSTIKQVFILISNFERSATFSKILIAKMAKRPRNAFIFYCMAERRTVQCALRTTEPTKVVKELSRRWRSMSGECKRKYEAMANQDKERYRRERAECKKE
jgi:hypothetical protein